MSRSTLRFLFLLLPNLHESFERRSRAWHKDSLPGRMIVHRQCEMRSMRRRKAIGSSFSTDRSPPTLAISVPSVDITLSLFTQMMLKRSKKKVERRFRLKFEKKSRQGKTNRDIDVKSIRVHCDSFSDLPLLHHRYR